MHITGLRLQSNQLHAQRDFYTQILGLQVVDSSSTHFSLQTGRTRISFESLTEPLAGLYHFAFNIPEGQFEEAKAWIQTRVDLLSAAEAPMETTFDFVSWNAHALYFCDAEGNILEFIARHNLHHDTNLPFSSDSLLSVSEIGLATPSVIGTVDDIARTTGIRAWRGAGSETFTAVGDEEGLFIVVEEGRSWRPTDDAPAYPIPTRIEILGLENIVEIPHVPYVLVPAEQMKIPH